MIDWLIDQYVIDYLIDWLIDQYVIDYLIDWLIEFFELLEEFVLFLGAENFG